MFRREKNGLKSYTAHCRKCTMNAKCGEGAGRSQRKGWAGIAGVSSQGQLLWLLLHVQKCSEHAAYSLLVPAVSLALSWDPALGNSSQATWTTSIIQQQ